MCTSKLTLVVLCWVYMCWLFWRAGPECTPSQALAIYLHGDSPWLRQFRKASARFLRVQQFFERLGPFRPSPFFSPFFTRFKNPLYRWSWKPAGLMVSQNCVRLLSLCYLLPIGSVSVHPWHFLHIVQSCYIMLHCPGGRAASDQQSAITVEFPAVFVHCFRQPATLLCDSGLNLGRTKRMKKTEWSVRMRCWKLGVAVRKVFPMNCSQCIPAKVLESMEMLGGKTELSIRFGLFMFIRVGLFNPWWECCNNRCQDLLLKAGSFTHIRLI